MTIGGIAAMAHAVFPFLFVTTASRALDGLNALRARGVRPPVSLER
jgi:carbon starvation protein CstA